MRRPHVVVVGDVVLDSDIDGRTERLCPDAPVPVVDVTGTRQSPGGAGLTALLCAASGAQVTLIAPVADDEPGQVLAEQLRRQVALVPLGHEGPTRRKVRVRSGGQSLVRIDDGGPGSPHDVPADQVRAVLSAADVVVVSDYGAGVTHHEGLRALVAEAAAERTVIWDPHPRGGSPVSGVTLTTPNVAEAQRAVDEMGIVAVPDGVAGERTESAAPDQLAAALREAWDVRAVCVTAGSQGAVLARGQGWPLVVPAPPASGDSCGAGDRFVASVAVALGRGAALAEAVADGVHDAAQWVADGGAEGFRRPAPDVVPTQPDVVPTHTNGVPTHTNGVSSRPDGLPSRLDGAPSRPAAVPTGPEAVPTGPEAAPAGPERASTRADGAPTGPEAVPTRPEAVQASGRGVDIDALVARVRTGGRTVVATGGCFDIVHAGHVATLQSARRLGDALVVLVNSDESVRRLKGPGRPLVTARDRARVLEAFDCVDAVVVFDEDEPTTVLDRLRPDVWAKGGDYGAAALPEAEVVQRHGGRVVLLPYLGGRSTTTIIERSGLARARSA